MEAKSRRYLIRVEDLKTYFHTLDGVVRAVDGVSLEIRPGETLGLVGESGCGKSVTALSLLRLVPCPPGRYAGGSVMLDGQDLLHLPEAELRKVRGQRISMIFQEPMTSLNPVFRVGYQVAEALRIHRRLPHREARERAVDMLRRVGIAEASARVDAYPHQLSGGMQQRIMIAMALICGPEILIADEPTTALDVTIQAQILDLLRGLQDDFHMSILLITHDLAVIAETAHHVAVMYAGKIVEYAGVEELFGSSMHPYTIGLFESLPGKGRRGEKLKAIPGQVPNPVAMPTGCRFHPRCPLRLDICPREEPQLEELSTGHFASCWVAKERHGRG